MEKSENQLGVFAWFGYRLHMAQRAKLIKDAGFDVTSLWWGVEEEENTGSLHDLPQIVRDAGLGIDNVHSPFEDANDLWSADKSVRQKLAVMYLTCIDDCARHEIPKMVMHLTSGADFPEPNSVGIDQFANILNYAKDRNIILAVENTRCPEHIDLVFSEFDSPNFGLCYDSSHDFLWSKTPLEILHKWGSRLIATHLADNDGVDDRHWPIGQGNIDWNQVAKSFPVQTYAQPLMVEMLPKNTFSGPGTLLKDAYQGLVSFVNKL